MIENVHTPMAVLVLLAVGASLCSCANPDKDAAEGIDYPETMGSASAAQLDAMVVAREMPEANNAALPVFKVPGTLKRTLTLAELATFDEEGYVVLRNFYNKEEINMLRECMATDPLVLGSAGKNFSVPDADGRETKLTLWWNFGDDSYGQIGRSSSMMQAASTLMGGAEPFASHTKILLKEPFTGGAWEWHQDFGYWYAQGINQPDKIVSGIIAVDQNDRENGAMRVLSGSHKLGRLDHGVYGGQAGADPERVLKAMATAGMHIRTLLLEPGDVAFTHSNLLHCSRPNDSDRWRRNVIVAYNSVGNDPMPEVKPAVQPSYTKAVIVDDGALLSKGCIKLDPARKDFLGGEESQEMVDKNPTLLDTSKDEL